MVANIFSGAYFARKYWISNLNPEIGRGYEIIIAFAEDSIGWTSGVLLVRDDNSVM